MKNCPRCQEPVALRGRAPINVPGFATLAEECPHPCHAAAQRVVEAAERWNVHRFEVRGELETLTDALDALDAAMAKPCKCAAGSWIATIKTICPAYKRAIRHGAARCMTCEHDEACHAMATP